MKILSVALLIGSALLAGCGTESNNANNSSSGAAVNMRGANTNTGYVTNSDTNVRPSMPTNATNISPPSMNTGNHNSNSNTNRNTNANSNSKANMTTTRKP